MPSSPLLGGGFSCHEPRSTGARGHPGSRQRHRRKSRPTNRAKPLPVLQVQLGLLRTKAAVEFDALRVLEDLHLHALLAQQGFGPRGVGRSEEHTSELQSRPHLVCRLLLEKKKKL